MKPIFPQDARDLYYIWARQAHCNVLWTELSDDEANAWRYLIELEDKAFEVALVDEIEKYRDDMYKDAYDEGYLDGIESCE